MEERTVAHLRARTGATITLVYGCNKIGRNDLPVSDKKVSRHHVTIGILNPGVGQEPIVYLEAVGLNPVLVGDNILNQGEKCPLQHGDQIFIATEDNAFTFLLDTSPKNQAKRKREEKEAAPNKSTLGDKKRRTNQVDSDGDDWDAEFALAFPSFGTNTFEFDIDKAATVACKEITAFLERNKNPKIRLVLVDLSESTTLQAFRKHYRLGDPRFLITSGNIVNLSDIGKPCRFIANAANGGLFSGGGGINAAINKAAGPSLDKATKRKYGFSPSVKAGGVYPVQVPSESPLRQSQGVEWCFHVLAPNMNPKRPHCLHDDYETGCALLQTCYSGMLKAYEAILAGQSPDSALVDEAPAKPLTIQQPKNRKPLANSTQISTAKPESKAKKAPAIGGWANLLAPYIQHPENYPPDVMYFYDEEMVVIFDKYPKAFKHLLVMPRKEIALQDLTRNDIPLLEGIIKRGNLVVQQLTGRYKTLHFKIGFHAIPSMRQLHMHVISDDFDAEALKTKKHWNSFTTNFFVNAEDVLHTLKTTGALVYDKQKYEAYLSLPLKCHKCTQTFTTLPKLKGHITTHS